MEKVFAMPVALMLMWSTMWKVMVEPSVPGRDKGD
jgi:hypothetical protein